MVVLAALKLPVSASCPHETISHSQEGFKGPDVYLVWGIVFDDEAPDEAPGLTTRSHDVVAELGPKLEADMQRRGRLSLIYGGPMVICTPYDQLRVAWRELDVFIKSMTTVQAPKVGKNQAGRGGGGGRSMQIYTDDADLCSLPASLICRRRPRLWCCTWRPSTSATSRWRRRRPTWVSSTTHQLGFLDVSIGVLIIHTTLHRRRDGPFAGRAGHGRGEGAEGRPAHHRAQRRGHPGAGRGVAPPRRRWSVGRERGAVLMCVLILDIPFCFKHTHTHTHVSST
jgi:hypothetical protein